MFLWLANLEFIEFSRTRVVVGPVLYYHSTDGMEFSLLYCAPVGFLHCLEHRHWSVRGSNSCSANHSLGRIYYSAIELFKIPIFSGFWGAIVVVLVQNSRAVVILASFRYSLSLSAWVRCVTFLRACFMYVKVAVIASVAWYRLTIGMTILYREPISVNVKKTFHLEINRANNVRGKNVANRNGHCPLPMGARGSSAILHALLVRSARMTLSSSGWFCFQ